MPRARPLPPPIDRRPFHVAQAAALGVGPSRLRASDLVAPTRGVRVAVRPEAMASGPPRTPAERQERLRAELVARAEQFAPALTADQFFSHETALALIGAPLPWTDAVALGLHVSARRPASQPRREGVVGHRLQRRERGHGAVRGLPVEHPARAWRQVGGSWRLDDLIAAGDFLVCPRHRLLGVEELRREVDEAGDLAGAPLRRALEEIRVGAETAEETRLRLVIVRAGLPEPEPNRELRAASGRFVARLDLAYPRWRVAVEHDGRTHAFDERQFARDADRWDDIRAQGWRHVRVLSHHLRPDPRVAARKVADALIAAGWRPETAPSS